MTVTEILRTLQTLYDDGDVIELRIIEDRGKNQAGYYDYKNFKKLANDAHKLDGVPGIPGIYITVNPVQRVLLARANNTIKRAKSTTTDSQIECRKYLPFDIDPERPAGVSSTDEMHDRSIEKAEEIKQWLSERGFPDPIIADSGNGAHLLYRIDQQNTPESKALIEAVQKVVIDALNHPNQDGIDIQGFSNASRIWKLYGTVAKKGDEIPEQGIRHRRSKMLDVPQTIQVVTNEQLKAVAALHQPEAPTETQQQNNPISNDNKFDIEGWMNTHDIKVVRTKTERNKTIYVLESCPLNSDHTGNKEAVIIQENDGKLGFKCHHNSCADKHWSDVREKFEPGYKEKKKKYEYFDEKNRFIPKNLADEILEEFDIITYQDTKEVAVYKNGVFDIVGGEDVVRVSALKKLDDGFKRDRINEVVEYVKLKTLVKRDTINPDTLLINVKNGMYDILGDVLLPHDPKYRSTIQLNVNYNKHAQCPEIDMFLDGVVKPDDVLVLVQYTGYSCIQDIKQQRALMIEGAMQNGKSTFIDLVCALVGQEHVAEQSIQSLNSDRFARAQLNGKLLNMFPDLPKKKLYDNSVFKMLTTDQWIDGEEKYIRKFRFKNTCHQIYSANQIPDVEDPDELAFFRRWIIITFPNSFEGKKADKNLLEKITTESELAGFFNICMIGLRALLEHGGFCYLPSVEDVRKIYLTKSNPVQAFLNECIEYSEHDYVKQYLFATYESWCERNDITNTLKNNVFGRKLKKLNYEEGREPDGQRRNVWKNIGFSLVGQGSVRDNKITLTDENNATDNENIYSRQGSRDKGYIVSKYKKMYENIYKLREFVGNNPGTLTDEKKHNVETSISRQGSKNNPDETLTSCNKCGQQHPLNKIEDGPAGLDKICHSCQNKLKVEQEKRYKTQSSDKPTEFVTIRILKNIPEFIGYDGKSYKLATADVCMLPYVNARALIKRKVAVLIDVDQHQRDQHKAIRDIIRGLQQSNGNTAEFNEIITAAKAQGVNDPITIIKKLKMDGSIHEVKPRLYQVI